MLTPEPTETDLRAAHRFLMLNEPYEQCMKRPAIAQCIRATARARLKKQAQVLKRVDFKKLACPDN